VRAHLAVAAVLLTACASGEVARLEDELAEAEERYDALAAHADALAEENADLRTENAELRTAPEAQPTEEATEEPPDEPAEPQTGASTIEDGIWQVGTDVRPGTYRAPGGANCYWARLRSANTSNIIVNGFGGKNQAVELTAEGEWFETDGCGTWTRL
jgi:regulator of replication initiation timing